MPVHARMPVDYLVFSAGLVALYFGADWLVRGASSLALHLGVRPLVIGLTVVALGTSMPEFILNLFASVKGEDSMAIGNIIGSNIANIALILGLSSLVYPTVVDPGTVKKEYPMVVGVSLLFWVLAYTGGGISRVDGIILLVGLTAFLIWLIRDARAHARREREEQASGRHAEPNGLSNGSVMNETHDAAAKTTHHDPDVSNFRRVVVRLRLATSNRMLLILSGCATLALGSNLMVDSAANIADSLGVARVVVGLTIVAIGTSLPELAASMMCAFRKEADMSIGNIFGSNLLNILFVVGLVAVIRPIAVEPVAISVHFPVMIFFTLLLLPLAWTRFRISRPEGALLLVGFFSYLAFLAYPYI